MIIKLSLRIITALKFKTPAAEDEHQTSDADLDIVKIFTLFGFFLLRFFFFLALFLLPDLNSFNVDKSNLPLSAETIKFPFSTILLLVLSETFLPFFAACEMCAVCAVSFSWFLIVVGAVVVVVDDEVTFAPSFSNPSSVNEPLKAISFSSSAGKGIFENVTV